MTSSNGNIFRVTGHLCGEFTGHKGQWRGALMFSFICAWIDGWVNNREAGDLRHHRPHYDVIVMTTPYFDRFSSGPITVAQAAFRQCFISDDLLTWFVNVKLIANDQSAWQQVASCEWKIKYCLTVTVFNFCTLRGETNLSGHLVFSHVKLHHKLWQFYKNKCYICRHLW